MISALRAFLNTVATIHCISRLEKRCQFFFQHTLEYLLLCCPVALLASQKVISSTPGGCCKRANKTVFEETHTNTSQGLLSNSCNARIQNSFKLLMSLDSYRTRTVCCTIQSPTAVKVTDNSGHNARELRVVYSACALYICYRYVRL